jgi:hypothetical protein
MFPACQFVRHPLQARGRKAHGYTVYIPFLVHASSRYYNEWAGDVLSKSTVSNRFNFIFSLRFVINDSAKAQLLLIIRVEMK